jgi:uncharacterized protein (TIGR03067 family)
MSASPLEGRWQPVRAELGGLAAPDEVLEKTEVEFIAGRYRVRFAGQVADRGTYTFVHEADAPGLLTLTGAEGTNAGRTIPSLFQLVGNRLRICYGMGGTRPLRFAAEIGTEHYLVTYRRKTP